MEPIFEYQLDYVMFFYGTAFFVLAAACFIALKRKDKTLPWIWLLLFGLVHGVNEWLDLLDIIQGGGVILTSVRFAALTLSFIFLLEFGIAGTFPNTAGLKWLPAVLMVLPLLGIGDGSAGAFSVSRYTLGLSGGLWAAAALFVAAGRHKNLPLKVAGAAMLLYGLETGLVVSTASFFPASALNNDTFLKFIHVPVQLVRTVTIYPGAVAVLYYILRPKDTYYFKIPLTALLFIIMCGFVFTAYIGSAAEEEAKKSLLSRALTAAAAINPERVARLTGTPADKNNPDFIRIRNQLRFIKAISPDLRFIYLMTIKDLKIIFLVDAEPETSKDYSAPGDIYKDATPQDFDDIRNGRNAVYPPYKDSWGTWVSGAGYIRDENGKVLAQVGMDIDAYQWARNIGRYRAFGILITFIICMLSFAFFLVWLRTRQAEDRGVKLRLAMQRLAGEKKLRDISSALGEGLIMQDAGGGISFVNPEAERLLGWSEQEITGLPMSRALKNHDVDYRAIPDENSAFALSLARGETIRVETEFFTRKDGSLLPVSYVSSPIREEGSVSGVVVAFQDISERKKLERQNQDFYAMVTHDLKSPVTVIHGYAELLGTMKANLLDEDAKTMVDTIKKSCVKLLSMANDFLTLSRHESGSLPLNESAEDITAFLTDVCSSLAPEAQKKGLTIETNIQESVPHALVDRIQLQRAVSNLLLNAINYTPAGGSVKVGAEISSIGEEKFIVISVADTGPGIPPDEAEKIFDKYYRASRSTDVRGSGLGLAIVKAVAAAHGGSVTLESTESKGSTFRLNIPLKAYYPPA